MALYSLTAHAAHGPPSGPECPALHVQSASAVLAMARDDESLGHVEQAASAHTV